MLSIHFFVSCSIVLFAPARDTSLELVLLRLLPFAAAIVLVILVTLFRRKKARERMQITQAAAVQLGWTFSAKVPWTYIPGLDRFTLFNQGALFGIGQGLGWLFAALSILTAAGIVYWLFIRGEARSWWLTVTLGLILAGALGNL